jgi:hypothetical protein
MPTKKVTRTWNDREQLRDIRRRAQPKLVRRLLQHWTRNVLNSKLEAVRQVARMIQEHFDWVLGWVRTRQTNRLMEALNGLFRAAKRKARDSSPSAGSSTSSPASSTSRRSTPTWRRCRPLTDSPGDLAGITPHAAGLPLKFESSGKTRARRSRRSCGTPLFPAIKSLSLALSVHHVTSGENLHLHTSQLAAPLGRNRAAICGTNDSAAFGGPRHSFGRRSGAASRRGERRRNRTGRLRAGTEARARLMRIKVRCNFQSSEPSHILWAVGRWQPGFAAWDRPWGLASLPVFWRSGRSTSRPSSPHRREARSPAAHPPTDHRRTPGTRRRAHRSAPRALRLAPRARRRAPHRSAPGAHRHRPAPRERHRPAPREHRHRPAPREHRHRRAPREHQHRRAPRARRQ